jgi:short-subunit dehydrogenase
MASRIFGRESTTDEVLAGVDCAGRVVLITGASGGLGAEAARALAAKGARVTITARALAKGRQVVDEIRTATFAP